MMESHKKKKRFGYLCFDVFYLKRSGFLSKRERGLSWVFVLLFFFFLGIRVLKLGSFPMGIHCIWLIALNWQKKDLIWVNGDINVCSLLSVR